MDAIYLLIEGKQEGPYTVAQVKQSLSEALIPPDLPAWHQGLPEEWRPISSIVESIPQPQPSPITIAESSPDARTIDSESPSLPVKVTNDVKYTISSIFKSFCAAVIGFFAFVGVIGHAIVSFATHEHALNVFHEGHDPLLIFAFIFYIFKLGFGLIYDPNEKQFSLLWFLSWLPYLLLLFILLFVFLLLVYKLEQWSAKRCLQAGRNRSRLQIAIGRISGLLARKTIYCAFLLTAVIVVCVITAVISSYYFSEQGISRLHNGNLDGAIVDFDKAIAIYPRDKITYCNRAKAESYKGNLNSAITDCDEAITIDPDFIDPYYYRGLAKTAKGDYDEAITDFNKVISVDPYQTSFYYFRGVDYLQKREYDKAIADFNQSIKVYSVVPIGEGKLPNEGTGGGAEFPFSSRVYNALAWLLATCPQTSYRDGKKAVDDATKACELTEWKDSSIVDTLAAACAETGDFDNAVKWESQFLAATNLTEKDRADAQRRLTLYQAHQPYHADK